MSSGCVALLEHRGDHALPIAREVFKAVLRYYGLTQLVLVQDDKFGLWHSDNSRGALRCRGVHIPGQGDTAMINFVLNRSYCTLIFYSISFKLTTQV
jgi:hypothetical protein